jgi:hypothetical protein
METDLDSVAHFNFMPNVFDKPTDQRRRFACCWSIGFIA